LLFHIPRRKAAAVAICAAILTARVCVAHAEDVTVDASAACATSGQSSPYCTITAALAAHHLPGTTIHVRPGIYREAVIPPASGASGSPIVLSGEGTADHPVVIDGADDFSSESLWGPATATTWLAASVTWPPAQVMVQDVPLHASEAPPESLDVDSYSFVPGVGLYVNLGGANPGDAAIEVGHRTAGVRLSNRSWITLQGFTVVNSDDRGIVASGCDNLELVQNVVRRSRVAGIQTAHCTAIHLASNEVSDSGLYGIGLTEATTGCLVERNQILRNSLPAAPSGAGLYVAASNGNRLVANVIHDNGKVGVQFVTGADQNVSVENVSWKNGGDGYGHLGATSTVHNGDLAFGNFGQGFSLNFGSTGTQMYNCVSYANGLRHYHFDLDVDSLSTSGFTSNDNLFWNPSGNDPIRFGGVSYNQVTSYAAATGQDTRTLQLDPWLAAPFLGDFRPRPGSPLIDSGNSATPDWSDADAAGQPRVDDPLTPDRGVGPVRNADRGAFEYVPADWSPAVGDTVPHLDHVLVVIMENKPYDLVRAAPYTSGLTSTYSSFEHAYSYQHQSQSDYYALWSAVGRGVTESICPAVGSPYTSENLGHDCETHGKTWRAYSEGLPAPGDSVCQVHEYVRRHCPWADWGNLNHKNELPFTDLAVDIARDSLPDLAFVIPNLCDDTHDQCGGDSVLVGDQWLSQNLPAMISGVGPRGVVILTWDEDDGSDGNHILTAFASSMVKTGYVSDRFVNHFVVTRTICDAIGIPAFAEAVDAKPITDVWLGQSSSSPMPPVPSPPPVQLSLGRASPNPFRGSVSLSLTLPFEQQVRAEVFDLAGRRVKTLLDGSRNGLLRLSWDGSLDLGGAAPAGVYLLRVRVGDTGFDRKLVMVK
jgi:acid phosphatase